MTDHELLSMLLDDELPEDQAASLQERIGTEPELAVAWATMQALPDALGGLPDLIPPPKLDGLVLGETAPAVAHAPPRWAWPATAIALAAALLLSLTARPPALEILPVTGHQRLTGELSIDAGDVTVQIDGTVDLFVEPVDPQLRESSPEDPTMTRKQLLAGLAGAAITVVVYEGTAVLHAADTEPVVLEAGEQHTSHPRADRDETPRVATRTSDREPTAEELQAELDALTEQLEAAQFHRAMAQGQLASHEGTPQDWPDDVNPALKPDAFAAELAQAMAGHEDLNLLSLECDEFPCFAVIESHSTSEDWGDDLDEVGRKLSESYKELLDTDEVGTGHWRSRYGDGDLDVRLEGMVLGAGGLDDEDLKTRTDYRVDSAVKDAAQDLMAAQEAGTE